MKIWLQKFLKVIFEVSFLRQKGFQEMEIQTSKNSPVAVSPFDQNI